MGRCQAEDSCGYLISYGKETYWKHSCLRVLNNNIEFESRLLVFVCVFGIYSWYEVTKLNIRVVLGQSNTMVGDSVGSLCEFSVECSTSADGGCR